MGVYEFTEQELDARQAAVDVFVREGVERNPMRIADRVAKRYGLSVREIMSDTRAVHVVRARKVLYRELRAVGMSYPSIGAFVGRDHTTVVAALNRTLKRGQP